MTAALLWLGAATVAALVAGAVAAAVAPLGVLARPNYRGLPVSGGLGIAWLAGLASGLGLVALVHAAARDAPTPAAAAAAAPTFLAAAFGFGLLGLWDDLAAGEERGWRGHLAAFGRGRITSGLLKLGGGGAIALVLVAGRGEGFLWAVVDAAVLAGIANLHNLLDLRPGRALKAFGLAAVPMIAFGGPTAPALAAGLGAGAACLPRDLRERAMLGDAGANGMGAVAGASAVALGSQAARLSLLGAVLLLHVLAERPGLGRIIASVPPLRVLDQAGRAGEERASGGGQP